MAGDLALVVVHHRSIAVLARLLEGLGACRPDEVVVIDNDDPGTDPEPLDRLLASHPDVRLLRPRENRGFGAGANLGVRSVSTTAVAVCNPDVVVDGAALRELAGYLRPGVAAVGPSFRDLAGAAQRTADVRDPGALRALYEWCPPFAGLAERVRPGWHPDLAPAELGAAESAVDVAAILGACMVLDREVVERVGGFDEGYFLYREDSDLCRRLRDQGQRVLYVPCVEVVHEGDASSRSDVPVPCRPAYIASHHRFVRRHRATQTSLVWVAGIVGAAIGVVLGPARRGPAAVLRWHLRRLARL